MILFPKAAGIAARKTVSALCLAGLLTTLAACAAGSTTEETITSPTAASTAAAPTPAATAAPHPLSRTEINEQCWMSSEVNKMKDLDAKAKYVDKCVAEKTRAQGM